MLIVDDDPAIRGLVRAVLNRLNLETFEAEDGAEALALLAVETFDAIVLDLMMPRVSGFEVIQFLEAHQPDTRCVVVMSAASDKTMDALQASVIRAKLRKPFDIHLLADSVLGCITS